MFAWMLGALAGYAFIRFVTDVADYPFWRIDAERAVRWVKGKTPRERYNIALRRELREIETRPGPLRYLSDGTTYCLPVWREDFTAAGEAARKRRDEIVRELVSRRAL